MNESLRRALERARPIIEAGIEEAERDLQQAQAKYDQLEAEIERVRAMLLLTESVVPSPKRRRRLYLHEAMLQVLHGATEQTMRAPFLAREINRRKMYLPRDGGPVTMHQIHTRVWRYPGLFERTAGGIRARV